MIDPIAAFSVATASFKSIKKVINTVQEMDQISGQLGKWYSSCADIARAEQQRKNPTFLEKVTQGKSIEEEALLIEAHRLEEEALLYGARSIEEEALRIDAQRL